MTLDRWATWREIMAQPAIWRGWAATLDADALKAWVAACDTPEIWFSGAGTSAFIGDILAAGLEGTGCFRGGPAGARAAGGAVWPVGQQRGNAGHA